MSLTAIILAGGKGTRMAPYAGPKCLAPVGGVPVLGLILDWLARRRGVVGRAIVCTGHHARQVTGFCAENFPDFAEVDFAGEEALQSERLVSAERKLETSEALVCYGDDYADVDLHGLIRTHRMRRAWVTMTVMEFRSPFGIVDFDSSGLVRQFREKPMLPYHHQIGYQLWDRKSFALLKRGEELPKFLARAARKGVLAAHVHRGSRTTINTMRDLEEANHHANLRHG